MSQSPYKGFNSRRMEILLGIIILSQSPYKGFNSEKEQAFFMNSMRLNPPIRGSIEIIPV